MTRFTISAAAALLIGAGCAASDHARPAKGTSATTLAKETAAPPAGGDSVLERAADRARVEGSPSATLWVVEVSDFQCPFCREWHDQSYQAIKKEFVDTGKIRLAYVNFPLNIHRNAWPAAEAAMCAAAQNKFWPMHDALFATQPQWESLSDPVPVLDSLARQVGVDSASYRQCTGQHAMRALIQADMERATEAGVNSTPTFFVGKTMIAGAQPTDVFRTAIDSALQGKR